MSLVQPPILNNGANLFNSVHHSNLMNAKPLEPLPELNREPGPTQYIPQLPPIHQLDPSVVPQPAPAPVSNPAIPSNYVLPDPRTNPASIPVPPQHPVSGIYGYFPQPLPAQASSTTYYSPVPPTHFDFPLSYPATGPSPPVPTPPVQYHTMPAVGCLPPYMPPPNMIPPNYHHHPLPQGGPPVGNMFLPPGNVLPSQGYPLVNQHQLQRSRSLSTPIVRKSSPRLGCRRHRRDEPGLLYEMLRPYECQQCGARQTPEWRRGPAECRVLCNACGLFHNKALKRKGRAEALRMLRERPRVRNAQESSDSSNTKLVAVLNN